MPRDPLHRHPADDYPPPPPHRPPHIMIMELEERFDHLEQIVGKLIEHVGFKPQVDFPKPRTLNNSYHHVPPPPPDRPPHIMALELEERIDHLENVISELIRHVDFKPTDGPLEK